MTVLSRSYGAISAEDGRAITTKTVFNLGSASKPYTAMAALLLEQRGRLSMDDDVRRWVPELPDNGHTIRVRDLMQHTSGFRDFQTLQLLSGRPVTTQHEFVDLIAGQRALNFVPGTRHEYSHTDFGILGTIVERAAGVSFGAYLRDTVFHPMGMRTAFVDDVAQTVRRERAMGHRVGHTGASVLFPDSKTFGGDNVYASVQDLAAWDRELARHNGPWSAIVARLQSRPLLPNGDTIPYAFGLRLGSYRGLRTISRGGHPPGTRAEFVRFPDHALAVATLCNSDVLVAPRLARTVAEVFLESRMQTTTPRLSAPKAVSLQRTELAMYAGSYRSVEDPWNSLVLKVRGDTLGEIVFDDANDEVFYPMTPAGNGQFFEIGSTGNVGVFSFRRALPQSALQVEISWNNGPAERLEKVDDAAVWRPTSAEISEYAGSWLNTDLDATWHLEDREGSLLLVRRGRPPLTLRPLTRDRFMRLFGADGETLLQVEFRRDSVGTLKELIVSTPAGEDSVRDLVFHRVTPPRRAP